MSLRPFRSRRANLAALVWLGTLGALLPGSAGACQICLPIPKRSAADRIVDAEIVVLARPDPEDPFSWKAVEVLKGENPPPIDLFVDSGMRRTFSVYTDRKMVLVHEDEGEGARWGRLEVADELFEKVVREIIDQSPAWAEDPRVRFDYFAKFFRHENSTLRSIAHLEVARAPYPDILSLARRMPLEPLREFLGDVRYVEWHALYILLLSQSEQEEDRERIRAAVRSAEQFGLTQQLAAWATAWIEIDEEVALDFLGEHFLAADDSSQRQLGAVVAAMSQHGRNGHQHLRPQIVGHYRRLLEVHPDLAPDIAPDLIAWQAWDLEPQIAEILASDQLELGLQRVLKLREYQTLAMAAQSAKASPKNGGDPVSGRGGQALIGITLLGLVALAIPVGMWALRR